MRLLKLPYPQAEQLFRRMVFNVMARNCDDHTKNHAFIMDKTGSWQLAPAFDVCHAYRPGSTWVSQQSLSVNGKRIGIGEEDLLQVAKSMNIKKSGKIIDHISDVVRQWQTFAVQTKVNPELAEAIQKTHLLYR